MKKTTPLDWLLPGVGHVRHGFRRESYKYFLFMGIWLATVLGRAGRIGQIWNEELDWVETDGWIALGFLAIFPLAWIWGARRGLNRLMAPPKKDSLSQWQISMALMRKNTRAMVGLQLLGVFYMIAFLCPVLSPFNPERIPRETLVNKLASPGMSVFVLGDTKRGEIFCREFTLDEEDDSKIFLDRVEDFAHKSVKLSRLGVPRKGWKLPPTGSRTINGTEIPYRREFHLLGTDEVGRDLLAGLIYGSRISLSIGFIAMLIAVAIGATVGTAAGYLGGAIDFGLMRFVDVLLAFPRLLLLMLIYAAYAASKEQVSIFLIVAILGATGWMGISRLVRAQILSLREQDFALAARSLGLGQGRIMFRHLLPNALAPLIVDATLRVGNTILVEASLSFLGMGVQKPTPSWGNIINGGKQYLDDAWWIATFPGFTIVFVVVSFNLVGDALRDAMDPKLRQ
jgi:peptide/nickel transport system permease protein